MATYPGKITSGRTNKGKIDGDNETSKTSENPNKKKQLTEVIQATLFGSLGNEVTKTHQHSPHIATVPPKKTKRRSSILLL